MEDVPMKKLITLLLAIMFVATLSTAALAGSEANADAQVDTQAAASIDDHSVTYSKVIDRKFVNAGITPLPQTQGFYTTPTPDSSFRSVAELFNDGENSIRLSEGALESLAKGGNVESNLQIIRDENMVPRVKVADEKGVKWLAITYHKPVFGEDKEGNQIIIGVMKPNALARTGFIDGEADDGDTNSFQVIGKCGLKALKDGNTHMVVTTEGAHRKVEAEGYGIGFYTTMAKVSDGGTVSGLGGGGLGYAYNEAGTEDRPWIQGYTAVSHKALERMKK